MSFSAIQGVCQHGDQHMANAGGRKPGRPRKNPAGDARPADSGGETTSGYFRRILKEIPRLLSAGSNKETLDRWLKDNPDVKTVPNNVRANLANIKSVLRKQGRARQARKETEQVAQPHGASAPPVRRPGHKLETLEEQIDDVLTLAKNIDREGLEQVI